MNRIYTLLRQYLSVFSKGKKAKAKIAKLTEPLSENVDVRLILDNTPGYVFWKDLNSVYRWCNKNGLELYGVKTLEDIVGKTDYDFNQELAEKFFQNDQYVLRTGQTHVSENDVVRTVTGKHLILKTEKKPLYDRSGKVVGVLGISLDITEQKDNERLTIENEINKTQLQQQERFRKIVDQAAHDVRSPIASLLMMVKMGLNIPENQRITLRNAAMRINDIATNLLSNYKSEQDDAKFTEERKPLLVFLALLEIITEKKYQYQSAAVSFETDFQPGCYFAFAEIEESAFKRTLSNIINNAVESFDEKPGVVTLRFDVDDVCIKVCVRDNGKGMSQSLIDKIVNNIAVTEGKEKGHGFGLTQVRETIQRNQGIFSIDSEIGKGTTIYLTFPRSKVPAWIAEKIPVKSKDTVVILDDETTIHDGWDAHFGKKAPSTSLMHFERADETLAFLNDIEQKENVLLLTDYELLKQDDNGLDVIEKAKIKRAILVTSHYADKHIQAQAIKLGVMILPKQLSPEVPILVEYDSHNQEKNLKIVDCILVDDNKNFLDTLADYALSGCDVDKYYDPHHFLENIARYPKNTKICLDNEFKNEGVSGLDIAKHLYNEGYTNLYLLSGSAFEAFSLPRYLTVLLKTDIEKVRNILSAKQ